MGGLETLDHVLPNFTPVSMHSLLYTITQLLVIEIRKILTLYCNPEWNTSKEDSSKHPQAADTPQTFHSVSPLSLHSKIYLKINA